MTFNKLGTEDLLRDNSRHPEKYNTRTFRKS
jgi:hypothetical protein